MPAANAMRMQDRICGLLRTAARPSRSRAAGRLTGAGTAVAAGLKRSSSHSVGR